MFLTNIILVALGGAFGSSSRYLIGELIILLARGVSFPVTTIFVNIFGSFLAGILHFILAVKLENLNSNLRLLLMAGFLGGFTTFSAFSLDVMRLVNAGQLQLAASYIILSVVFSILAIFFGFYLSSLIAG